MFLKRFLLILLLVLGLAGVAWAALYLGTSPIAPEGEEQQAEPRLRSGVEGKASFEAAVAEAAARPQSAIDYARMDERIRALVARPHMVGLAVAIIEDGEIRFIKGYGETVAGSGDPVTPETIFRWASLSKGVAGDMVALLAAQGKVSLYAPVGTYAPSLRLPSGNEQKATVSDLLSHRLGIFGHAYDSKLEDGEDPRYLRGSLATLNAICPPGQCHAYQNVAFDAASEIVEKVTGQSYAQAVDEQLFRPLGMDTASMSRAALLAAPSWARPHVGGRNSRPVEVTEPYYRVPAAGGVNGSIKDLALWARAQMGETPGVLPPEVLAAVQAPRSHTPRENRRRRNFQERISSASYGLGWRIFDYAGNKVIGHHGGLRGYRSLILFDPVRKTGVVALWNSSTGQPNGIEYEVMDMLYGLDFRDWLKLGEDPPPPEASAPDAPEMEEQGGR